MRAACGVWLSAPTMPGWMACACDLGHKGLQDVVWNGVGKQTSAAREEVKMPFLLSWGLLARYAAATAASHTNTALSS